MPLAERCRECGSVRAWGTSWSGVEEVSERHGFLAVRARAAWSDAAAEEATVGAALLTEQAGFAVRALIDDARLWSLAGQYRQRGHLALAPNRLPTGDRKSVV